MRTQCKREFIAVKGNVRTPEECNLINKEVFSLDSKNPEWSLSKISHF